MSFDPRSFDPMSFDPRSFDPGSFDPKSVDPRSVNHFIVEISKVYDIRLQRYIEIRILEFVAKSKFL